MLLCFSHFSALKSNWNYLLCVFLFIVSLFFPSPPWELTCVSAVSPWPRTRLSPARYLIYIRWMNARMKMLKCTRHTKRKQHTLHPEYKSSLNEEVPFIDLQSSPVQKNHSHINNLCISDSLKWTQPQKYSPSVSACQKLLLPFLSGILPSLKSFLHTATSVIFLKHKSEQVIPLPITLWCPPTPSEPSNRI